MMKFSSQILRAACGAITVALLVLDAFMHPALAGNALLFAQGAPDCYAIGQRIAAQQGGRLARAAAESQGGNTVCRIVILVPGREGERPRRTELVVPAG
ncbi:hypothetical protein [Chelativorans sp. Marseille-P2723]|uniref:hypothetical protein n=1 Tax=Chelativorans sp. Marseille-P2723 TaxID=2709133 RepID=UPI001FEF93AC|nr:hypothetical protein [Chelativorans sp. Marseille-P2723]